ncbi:alcohol dehydrogenase [Novosphingobium sp. PY1]|nr:alcohol dehydrogenase [Novosphingobium sp. PY1]
MRIAVDYLSMDAGTRMWMSPRTDGYQPPLPLGSKMVGLCLGRVSETRDPAFPAGSLVRGFGQWSDYATLTPALAGLEIVDDTIADPRQHFGALGMNAWTAYVGVKEVAAVKSGEWLAVSAAAGATGSLACQVGKNLGAKVVGIAGGPDKCRYLLEELGCDMAIDYRGEDVEARLATVDGGINAFFDNVGGPILDAVLPNMAHYGRVAICGLVAGYDNDAPMPGPARFDQILMRRLRIEGFFIPDFLERGAEFLPQLRQWMDEGKLSTRFDETQGLENVLVAYERMLTGKNIGKAIVRL